MNAPFVRIAPAPSAIALLDAAVAYETARQRKRHGIGPLDLTPNYIELAVSKAFSPLPDGSYTPERVAAEAAVRRGA